MAEQAHTPGPPRLMVCRDALTGSMQLSIDDDNGGFRLAGPKFNGSSRTLMDVPLGRRERQEIAQYIGYADLLDALRRLATPASGVKMLPAWAVGIANAAIARAEGGAS